MTASTDPVELLERAVSYARRALDSIGDDLTVPTPCRAWTLMELLDHMSDSLDALIEASGGAVALSVPARATIGEPLRVETLQHKACALVGVWAGRGTGRVQIGDTDIHPEILVRTGALEIAVHGWDVAVASGRDDDMPAELCGALLPTAELLVSSADRGVRFAEPIPVPHSASATARLLGFLGRAAA